MEGPSKPETLARAPFPSPSPTPFYAVWLCQSEAAAPMIPFYDCGLEAHLGREGVKKAFAELSGDQRETIRLTFFEGYTLEEAAEHLQQSYGNVRHHYYRALERLRQHLPQSGSKGL